ncbi:MAG: DVUA0089 family protein [Gemmatimonadota bacterium]|nr:MAG: DVUA0089 family protein [Gemmatimonadota bacterium]
MFRRLLCLAAIVGMADAGEALAQKPTTKDPNQERARLFYKWSPSHTLKHSPVLSAAVVNESEPNDGPASADAVSLGDQGTGDVDPSGDIDYWIFSAAAGDILDIDVDASQVGSPLDPMLELFASDGVTSLAFNDDYDDLDSRIQYTVQAAGNYYMAISGFSDMGGPGYFYSINFNLLVCDDSGYLETEPNNEAGSADAVNLGDVATGVMCATGDVDYWSFSAPAGTTLDIDVDAWAVGSSLDSFLELFDSDGVTSLASNDDFDGLDSRIQYTVQATGTYFIAISDLGGRGGPDFFYAINFRTLVPGPGDPTTVFASGFDAPAGLAFDRAGNLFVADLFLEQLWRVTPDGSASVFATGIPGPLGIAFDGFGDLLVAGNDGIVYKVSDTGVSTAFLTQVDCPFWIATGPDGSIWVSDICADRIFRFDAFGALQEGFDVSSVGGVSFLAFSPAGELHFSNSFANAVFKLVAGQPQLVFTGDQFLEGFAFDVNGNLYVPNEIRGRVILYGADGTVLEDPFALTVQSPVALAFGRDADGTTNARLFATDFGAGAIVEMNPAGISAPGWPVGVELLVVSPDALPDGVVGADYTALLTVTDQGVTPTWSVIEGALPPGISLDSGTGVLGDYPTEAGTFAFRVRAESGARFGEKDYSITVTEATLAVTDVVNAILGVDGVLSPDEERYLDLLGNSNGVFDVGDFRAFLEATGGLGSAARLTDHALMESWKVDHGLNSGKGAQ